MHKLDGYPHDYHRLLYTFRVKSRTKDVGIYRPPHEWHFSDGIKLDEGVERRMKGSSGARLLDRAESASCAAAVRARGRTVVFTNGVFDLLHPGHVRYLREAASLGDVLMVGLNTDASVRRNKGQGRPITPELERAEIVPARSSASRP